MSQRAKGQDARILVVGPEGREEGIVAVQNFEATIKIDRLSENYLGETAMRYDEIFNGIEGKFDLHMESTAYFSFAERAMARAKRTIPASVQFNIMAVMNLPNGERMRTLYEDVFFGDLPLNIGGRPDYIQLSVDFAGSKVRFIAN